MTAEELMCKIYELIDRGSINSTADVCIERDACKLRKCEYCEECERCNDCEKCECETHEYDERTFNDFVIELKSYNEVTLEEI